MFDGPKPNEASPYHDEIPEKLVEQMHQTDATMGQALDQMFNLLCVGQNMQQHDVVVQMQWDSKKKDFI